MDVKPTSVRKGCFHSTRREPQVARRQRRRLPPAPAGTGPAWYQAADRPPRRGVERTPWTASLEGGADVRVGAGVPPPHRPLRAPPRLGRGLPAPGLCAHLPALPAARGGGVRSPLTPA